MYPPVFSFDGLKVTFYVEPELYRNASEVAKIISKLLKTESNLWAEARNDLDRFFCALVKKKDVIEKDLGIKIQSTGIGREVIYPNYMKKD